MKQFMLLMTMLTLGGVGSLFEPFWGVLVYYSFAVLRPQYLWKWALPAEMRWSLIAALIAIGSVVLNLSRVIGKGRLNTVAIFMTAYGLLAMLSCLTAFDPGVAQHWAIEYAKVVLIGLIGSLVIRQLWQVQALALMIMIALGYVAWEINYLYLFNHRLDVFHRGYGNLDNNGAGLMLAMGIPFAFCFSVSAQRLWQRLASVFLGLLMLHAMLMTYSRGAMVSAAIGGVWLLWRYRPRWQAAGIAGVLCLAVSVLAGQQIRERFWSTMDFQQDGSAQSRLDSWAAAMEIVWDHPLAGVGIRNSNQYTQNYGADKLGRTTHSQYLQIAADSGLPALGAYGAMLIAAVLHLRQSRRLCQEHTELDDLPVRQGINPNHEFSQNFRGRNFRGWNFRGRGEQIALACQASLIIFMIDGSFLSLEMFELPWLVVVMAGVLPGAIQHELENRSNPTIQTDKKFDVAKCAKPRRPALFEKSPAGLTQT